MWGHEDDAGVGPAEGFDGGEEGAGLEEHALAATAEGVIDAAVFIGGPIAELVGVDFDDSGIAGALDDGVAEGGEGDFREQRDDVDAHGLKRDFSGRGCLFWRGGRGR